MISPTRTSTELSGEIRDFIVAAVAENSGHLGSNLGAVELTLALHRVFDSPTDAILWDTGHQAYVHKLVTGRQAGFAELRQAGGLSGYPSREESRHDYVENSHASTILSYAYGMAVARDAGVDPHRHIVAVIGDGSMTGGMAYEALNNLGHSRRRVIIVLNDNGRSYAPDGVQPDDDASAATVEAEDQHGLVSRIGDRLSHALTEIRLNPTYVRRQRKLEERLRDVPVVGTPAERAVEAFKAAVREFLQPPSFFEALGVRYVGPVDGHDIPALEHALRNAERAVGRGPDRRPRDHPEGPRLPAGRGRRREAPPRRPGVRPARPVRRRPCRPGTRRRSPRRSSRRPRPTRGSWRSPRRWPARPACCRSRPASPTASSTSASPSSTPSPGAAGMAMGGLRPGRGDLLDVPQPGVGPGRLRRRAAPPARRVLPRPGRHHRPRRRQPPRRVRHGDARPRARACGSWRRRAPRSCTRCCTTP